MNQERGFNITEPSKKLVMLLEEAGELAKAVRKVSGLKFTDTTRQTDLREELADVQIVLLGLASMMDVDMFDAVIEKERKNRGKKMEMKQLTPYRAPQFSLPDSEGGLHLLTDYKGKWVVLYFYPKDDTPGCTTEACSLRDARDDIASLGAEIIGVSKDDASSHEKFKAKHSLNFTLLTDKDGTTINAYGAWGKKMFGVEGILRKTFIIDPNGQVVKVYGRVTPLGHGDQVVAELKRLQVQ